MVGEQFKKTMKEGLWAQIIGEFVRNVNVRTS